MTPGARVAAAIAVLDQIGEGRAAEQALTSWARGARYAGSKDRAAVRDHVFGVLRRWRSCAAIGGAETGRALMHGALLQDGIDPATAFTGQGHAPAPLSPAEGALAGPVQGDAALDLPDWTLAPLRAALGDAFEPVALRLRERAQLHLRVNSRKASVAQAIDALRAEGIAARPMGLSPTALEVTEGARRVAQSAAYADGRVEIQDAASQGAADTVPLQPDDRVLDFCAGGGGKSLALCARARIEAFAHDLDAGRMKDLPARALRAGVEIRRLSRAEVSDAAPFDVVVADVPCSGAGAWRRQPEAKWRLTPSRLEDLTAIQDEILATCADLCAPRGKLVYITCSLFRAENEDRIDAFVTANPDWQIVQMRRFSPMEGGDGLFSTVLSRKG